MSRHENIIAAIVCTAFVGSVGFLAWAQHRPPRRYEHPLYACAQNGNVGFAIKDRFRNDYAWSDTLDLDPSVMETRAQYVFVACPKEKYP